MGINSFQRKSKLLKHTPIKMRISTKEMPTVTMRSERILPALATLPMGSP